MSNGQALTRDELAAAGRLLHGDRWQRGLARDLGVGERTMRRYAAGESELQPDGEQKLAALLYCRYAEIESMLTFFEARIAPSPSATAEAIGMRGSVNAGGEAGLGASG